MEKINFTKEDMKTLFTKEEVQGAVKRLATFFQNYKGEYFGLDDLGMIDIYIESH